MVTAGRPADATAVEIANVHVHRRPPDAAPGDSDAVTVVLLHGICDAGHCWETVAAELDPAFDVLMPDARGHGTTPLPDGPVTLEALVDDVAFRLDGGPSVVVIGHSMGAGTAVALAAARPDLVRAIVLEDPPWGSDVLDPPDVLDPASRGPRAGVDFAAWVRELQSLDHAGRVATGRRSDPHWSEAELQRWAVAKDQVDLRFFDRMEPGMPGRAWRLLPQVTVPVVLMTGDPAAGAIVTAAVGDAATHRLPGLEVLHIDGAGHSIHRDRLAPYLEGVHEALGRILT